jgi:oligogalacturonide lyase
LIGLGSRGAGGQDARLHFVKRHRRRFAVIGGGAVGAAFAVFALAATASAHIGQRFPSERKIVLDPVTRVPLLFLTSTPAGDSKIYQTHPQWTADGAWLIFRSRRVAGQAFAVNETTGDIVQVTETGYTGMLSVGRKSMRLFFLRRADHAQPPPSPPAAVPMQLVAIDLQNLFADSKAGTMRPAAAYEQVFGTVPAGVTDGHELAIDATEEVAYYRLTPEAAAKSLPTDVKPEPNFGPRKLGAGPTGIGSMDLKTGALKVVVAVPFQVGHIQTNPFVPGEIVFCWETGGKAPQRTWTVRADGTGLRPLFPEASYDWVTHEAVITPDEVAFAIMGHRAPGTNDDWGPSGTRAHPTGLGIVNLRTREVYIAGQTKSGSGLWHVHGSADGRWAVGDDFKRNIYLIDRHTNEMMLLSAGHKETAADHPHPTFNPNGKEIEIESAMLSADGRAMNICIIPVPDAWLRRQTDDRAASSP